MGCLNSEGQFKHWFGNIHLSGPCNRACYFCIGQHMMALDPLNTLDKWPLDGFGAFISECRAKGVKEVNVTGSNTDPMLYRHTIELTQELRDLIPGCVIGIRTNGAATFTNPIAWRCYDKASVSITSLNPDIYRATMGNGEPPDVRKLMSLKPSMALKVNVVLCPESLREKDLFETLTDLARFGIQKVNLREPYGQPRIGCPIHESPIGYRFGMPVFDWNGMEVTYWDVHYVEVESVNLYANGIVSTTYPVTRGHHPSGEVIGQESWLKSGRVRKQWLSATIFGMAQRSGLGTS